MTIHCRWLCVLAILFLVGCTALEPTGTPTPNSTLLAISRMLTETRAAPTTTLAPSLTPTTIITPSQTAEVIVPGSKKLPVAVNESFTYGNTRLTILSIQAVNAVNKQKAGDGKIFLDVQLAVENIGSERISYNRLDFHLIDQNGEDVFPMSETTGPMLLSGELPAGEYVRGYTTFQIDWPTGPIFFLYKPEGLESNTMAQVWFSWDGSSELQAPTPQPHTQWPPAGVPSVGQRINIDGVSLTVEGVQENPRLAIGKAQAGMRYVALAVRIENTGRVKSPYNALYFRMKDAQGYEYIPILGAPEESLQPGSLSRGRSVRGIVFFELPENARNVLLTYLPSVLFETYTPIQVSVALPGDT